MELQKKLTVKDMKEIVNQIITTEEIKENITIQKNPITFIEWLQHDSFKKKIKLYKGINKLTLIKQPFDIFGIYEEDERELFIYLNKFKKIKKLNNNNLIISLLAVTYHEFGHAIQYEKHKFATDKKIDQKFYISFFSFIQQLEDLIIDKDKFFYEISYCGKFLLEIDANLYAFTKIKELLQVNNPKLYEEYKELIEEKITEYTYEFDNFDFNFIFEKSYEIYKTNICQYQNKIKIFQLIFNDNSSEFKSITNIINDGTNSFVDKKIIYSIITSKLFLKQLDFSNLEDEEITVLIEALKYMPIKKREVSNNTKINYLKLKDYFKNLIGVQENESLINEKYLIENPINLLAHLEELQQKRTQIKNTHHNK